VFINYSPTGLYLVIKYNISVGTSALLIFLFVWGIVGLSGWLANVIVNINEILKGLVKNKY